MKLQNLFEMCLNLGRGTIVVVRDFRTGIFLDEGYYTDMHAIYGEHEIGQFSIEGDRQLTIYVIQGDAK